jgi:hypothetical protein
VTYCNWLMSFIKNWTTFMPCHVYGWGIECWSCPSSVRLSVTLCILRLFQRNHLLIEILQLLCTHLWMCLWWFGSAWTFLKKITCSWTCSYIYPIQRSCEGKMFLIRQSVLVSLHVVTRIAHTFTDGYTRNFGKLSVIVKA